MNNILEEICLECNGSGFNIVRHRTLFHITGFSVCEKCLVFDQKTLDKKFISWCYKRDINNSHFSKEKING